MRITAPPLPLSRFPRLRTHDFDEASALYGRLAVPVAVQKSSKQPFAWQSNGTNVGPVALSANAYGGGFSARSREGSELFVLSIPLGAAEAEGRCGEETTTLAAGKSGFMTSPGQSTTVALQDGYRGVHLTVSKSDMESALSTLTGSAPRGGLIFQQRIVLDAPRAAPFLRLLQFVLSEAEHEDSALSLALAAGRLGEALLFHLLDAQPHNQTQGLAMRSRPAEPSYVRRAAEYLDAQLALPVTMSDLVRLTGVGARSLQVGFRKHRGCTPMEFLRQRRLVRARELLLATSSMTVTQIALASGFEHLGRFSAQYRAQFGESPSQTRARR